MQLSTFLGAAAFSALSLTVNLDAPPKTKVESVIEEAQPVVEVVEEPTVSMWTLPNATPVEKKLLHILQVRGIEDKNAIAAVLGNVKQESKFHPNICEGGARISYWSCKRGGYGLIQWTSPGRVNGLAQHANSLGLDPSQASAQISYLFTERQWKHIEPSLNNDGHSIEYYMNKTYYWIGWGIHGKRTTYAYDYANNLVSVEVPLSQVPNVRAKVRG